MIEALHLAAELGPVLPLDPRTRRPLIAFDHASADPAEIASWFDRWSCVVGPVAGLCSILVVDVEHPSKGGPDGAVTLRALEDRIGTLPPTRVHGTKSGGRHYVFALPRSVALRSAQCRIRGLDLDAPGVDIVAGRAVIRWAPIVPGYVVESDAEIARLPQAWIAALSDPPAPVRTPLPRLTMREDRARRYALVALEREAVEVAEKSAGRNVALTAAAFRLGRLSPPLLHSEITEALWRACEINGSAREHGVRRCLSTIERGIQAGSKNPRREVA